MTRHNLIAKIERTNPIFYGIERHLLGLDFPNQSTNFDYSRLVISSNQVVRSIHALTVHRSILNNVSEETLIKKKRPVIPYSNIWFSSIKGLITGVMIRNNSVGSSIGYTNLLGVNVNISATLQKSNRNQF